MATRKPAVTRALRLASSLCPMFLRDYQSRGQATLAIIALAFLDFLLPGSTFWRSTLFYAMGLSIAVLMVNRIVVGGILGAILLVMTPTAVFDRLIPLLILFATLLFMAQEPLQRRFNLAAAHASGSHWRGPSSASRGTNAA